MRAVLGTFGGPQRSVGSRDGSVLPSASLQKARCEGRAQLVRKIVLARFLERSPEAVIAAVEEAENVALRHGLFTGRRPVVRVFYDDYGCNDGSAGVCGSVEVRGGKFVLVFGKRFACEYEVHRNRLAARLAAEADPGEAGRLLRAVRTLLLVTARNRIARSISTILVEAQQDFLASCDDALLMPFTVRELVRRARVAGVSLVDESRASRVLRSTPIALPDGAGRLLGALCPSTRTVLAGLVREVLERERSLREEGRLRGAWNDAEIARRVRRVKGVFVSRRLVAYCRRRLGVPGARVRARFGAYMSETTDFSPLQPLDRRSVLRGAAVAPGVYELRLRPAGVSSRTRCAGIIYIGRATNLRIRLLDHAGASVRNERLVRHLRSGRVLFRFRIESRDLRQAEAELYRRFCETYGHPPECNRVAP